MGKGDKEGAEAVKAEVEQIKADLPAREEPSAPPMPRWPTAGHAAQPARRWRARRRRGRQCRAEALGQPRPAEGREGAFRHRRPAGLDFESAQAVSGARFAYLRGPIARLNRAMGQFMLDTHTEKFGYQEVVPPCWCATRRCWHRATAQVCRGSVPDHRWPLADPHRRGEPDQPGARPDPRGHLPLRFTALTLCFRSEAGAAGRIRAA
jgi:seryl-tRNA synthetase